MLGPEPRAALLVPKTGQKGLVLFMFACMLLEDCLLSGRLAEELPREQNPVQKPVG